MGQIATATRIGIVAEETPFQRYGRNLCHVVKTPPGTFVPRDQTKGTSERSFEKSHRRSWCHGYNAQWNAGHRCARGAIGSHDRDRLKTDESSKQIFSDRVLGMEGDLDRDTRGDTSRDYDDEQEQDDHANVHFGELEVFDTLNNDDYVSSMSEHEIVQRVDKKWFRQYLFASEKVIEHAATPHQELLRRHGRAPHPDCPN